MPIENINVSRRVDGPDDGRAPRTPATRAQRRLLERYGPWAVVTGASSGIGRAVATELAAAGFDIVLIARRTALLDDLASSLHAEHGTSCRVEALDLTGTTGIDELERATGDLDVGLLVTAAGFGTSGAFVDADLRDELDMLDVNCRAVTAQTWAFARRFVERGRGGIVLLGSIVGFQGAPYAAHYAATKAYVFALGEALHVELRSRGVDVLAAAPGPVDSGFADVADMRMSGASDPAAIARSMLRHLGRRGTVLPGPRARFLRGSVALLPRRGRVRVMGRVMGGMTSHQRQAQR